MVRFRPTEVRRARPVVTAAALTAAAVIAPAGAASATPPDHGTFSTHDVFLDSEVCAPEGFSVHVVEDEASAFRVYFDRSGDVKFVALHVDYRAVISANGHTIVERDRWKDTFYPDGTARTVGNTVHIQGAGPGWSSTTPASSSSTPTVPSPQSTARTRSSRARRSASRCCREPRRAYLVVTPPGRASLPEAGLERPVRRLRIGT